MLVATNIVKKYDGKTILHGLSFAIQPGSIFGLLGPNGAGKSTLLRILTHLTKPDAGSVSFFGEPLTRHHARFIGYMPEERGLYKNMTVTEQLLYFASLHGLPRQQALETIHHWLQKLDMQEAAHKQVQTLSKGMSQKIQFILTILHRPKLLILDEPFSGLDPISAQLIEEAILELKQQGTCIILSTHRMDQVEHFCDQIVLLYQGKSILSGEVKGLKQQFQKNQFEIHYEGRIAESILSDYRILSHRPGHLVIHQASLEQQRMLISQLFYHGVHISNFQNILPSMQEIFIDQVQKQAPDAEFIPLSTAA